MVFFFFFCKILFVDVDELGLYFQQFPDHAQYLHLGPRSQVRTELFDAVENGRVQGIVLDGHQFPDNAVPLVVHADEVFDEIVVVGVRVRGTRDGRLGPKFGNALRRVAVHLEQLGPCHFLQIREKLPDRLVQHFK